MDFSFVLSVDALGYDLMPNYMNFVNYSKFGWSLNSNCRTENPQPKGCGYQARGVGRRDLQVA
jgi:hypothetical protein